MKKKTVEPLSVRLEKALPREHRMRILKALQNIKKKGL